MRIERFDVDHQRYLGHPDPTGELCYYKDVAKLEASHAELLEALEWIARQYDDSKPTFQCASDAYAMAAWARAAIAKAKGEGV